MTYEYISKKNIVDAMFYIATSQTSLKQQCDNICKRLAECDLSFEVEPETWVIKVNEKYAFNLLEVAPNEWAIDPYNTKKGFTIKVSQVVAFSDQGTVEVYHYSAFNEVYYLLLPDYILEALDRSQLTKNPLEAASCNQDIDFFYEAKTKLHLYEDIKYQYGCLKLRLETEYERLKF